ncbi:MAG: VOC family protein [Cyclobacteriaceae bacterium]
MAQKIASIALVVKDYDEALNYFLEKLSFELIEDTNMGNGKRWVVISPPGNVNGTNLILAKAKNDAELKAVGNQTGGRVFLFIHTDDFKRDYDFMKLQGVNFIEAPRNEAYGKVVVFKDLYGNKWDLVGRDS